MNALKLKSVKSISILFFLAIFTFIMTGCQSQNDVRADVLLDNLISEDEDGFVFEHISWGATKQELIEENHIPEKGIIEGAAESLRLDHNVTFKDPESDATVMYQFQDDVFIGGEYSIEAENQDDLVQIAGELKDQLSKKVGEPDSNTLDELSEESVRRGSNGVTYLDNGKGSLSISFPQNRDLTIGISTRGPEELLEKRILEKDE